MSETTSAVAAQKAVSCLVQHEDWANAFTYAQQAYSDGIREPAIMWILGYAYAVGEVTRKDIGLAYHYLKAIADVDISDHDHWIDKARAYLMVNCAGRDPLFGRNEPEAARYAELLYNDSNSNWREEALRILCFTYGDVTSPALDTQKAAMYIRQALLSQNSQTQEAANAVYKNLRQVVVRESVNRHDSQGSYSPTLTERAASAIWTQIKDAPRAGGATTNRESSGGCYVATAVYGSYDCPEVWTLRRYRDYVLAKSIWGRAFIRGYYAVSPHLVKHFGHVALFNKVFKPTLDYIVHSLNNRGIADTPYVD